MDNGFPAECWTRRRRQRSYALNCSRVFVAIFLLTHSARADPMLLLNTLLAALVCALVMRNIDLIVSHAAKGALAFSPVSLEPRRIEVHPVRDDPFWRSRVIPPFAHLATQRNLTNCASQHTLGQCSKPPLLHSPSLGVSSLDLGRRLAGGPFLLH